jgi:hypothetical protein
MRPFKACSSIENWALVSFVIASASLAHRVLGHDQEIAPARSLEHVPVENGLDVFVRRHVFGLKEADFADATQIFECQIHSARTIYNTLLGGGPLSRASALTSESMVCRYSEEFNTYLRKNYGLNDDALTFFTVHMVADKDHTAQAAERIALAVKTPRDERIVRENAQYMVRIKLGKFEGLYREYA